jgi:molecular chaperone GrpE
MKENHTQSKKDETVSPEPNVPPQVTDTPSSDAQAQERHEKSAKDKRIWVSRSRLEELEKKAQQTQFYLDHLQRLQAEFDNFRKRSVKDREDFRKFLLEDFILELLEILDNFERALDAFRSSQDLGSLKTGVELIYRQFRDCLIRRGVGEIESLGQAFDPVKHDAVCYEESEKHLPHQVMDQMAKGYLLHGKVIRPAKVKVSKEAKPSQSEPSTS